MEKVVYLVNVARKTNQVQLPMSFSVLINALKYHGIEIKLIDLMPIPLEEREAFFESVLPKEPAIFGFTIIAGNYHLDETEKYAKRILKANPENVIIYGGPLPSAIPEMMFEKCSCDYIVAGEGEITLPALVNSIFQGVYYPEHIEGVYYKKGNYVYGKKYRRMRKLDHLSNPDYSLIDMDFYINYYVETGQSFQIMASRGCVANCSFCLKFCGNGLSFRSVDSVLDEIAYVIENYKLNRFYFVDENFLQIKKFFYEFINKKKERKLDFSFIGQSRIDAISEDICRLGSENGLRCISMGVESVNQQILDKINKNLSIEEVEDKLKLLVKYDIDMSLNFIIGFPWETERDYIELIKFVERNSLQKKFKLSYLTPLPSTQLYQEVLEKGFIKDEYEYIRNLGNLYWERMINLTSLPDDVLDYYYQKIYQIGQKDVVYPNTRKYLMQISKIY